MRKSKSTGFRIANPERVKWDQLRRRSNAAVPIPNKKGYRRKPKYPDKE